MKVLRHTLYNLLGLGLPLIAAVFCIPLLIRELGDARFGLLTLLWAIVSYFGLFDLGLGRALTLQLAASSVADDNKCVGPFVATATLLMSGLGVLSGVLMAALGSWSVGLLQSVPNEQEALNTLLIMAVAMPSIILTSGFRGVLEAYHKFGIVNAIRLPMGLFTFIAPAVVVILCGPRLDFIAFALAVGRIVACAVHAWFAWRALPKDHGAFVFKKKLVKPLCISGGWLMVGNVIAPLMGYVDRFMIGAVISATAVAYYTTPQEIVTKLWVLPGALTAVLFPKFASQTAKDIQGARELLENAIQLIYLTVMPITVFLALFSYEIISIWIGPEFSQHSSILLRIFSIGIFLNCLAQIPFTFIQGAGLPRITAMTQLVELPLYLASLWLLASNYGIGGAGLAWLLRIVFDSSLMFVYSYKLQGLDSSDFKTSKVLGYISLAGISFSGVVAEMPETRSLFFLFSLMVSIYMFVSSSFGKAFLLGEKNHA